MLIAFLFSLYIIGCILSLFIYQVKLYEKYNKNKINYDIKIDCINSLQILLSWIYIINIIYKQKIID